MSIVKLSPTYKITIPKPIRDKMGIKPGAQLQFFASRTELNSSLSRT